VDGRGNVETVYARGEGVVKCRFCYGRGC
jgi:hypothetical protein